MKRRCAVALMALGSAFLTASGRAGDDAAVAERLARVREIHGAAGPWAVAGSRMGERAWKEWGLPKHAPTHKVVHRRPAQCGIPASRTASRRRRVAGLRDEDILTMAEWSGERRIGRFALRDELRKNSLETATAAGDTRSRTLVIGSSSPGGRPPCLGSLVVVSR